MKSQIQKKKNGGIVELLTTIFQKKASHDWGDKNFFGQKNYGAVVLDWMTNDQIMPRFRRCFINKCIFQ